MDLFASAGFGVRSQFLSSPSVAEAHQINVAEADDQRQLRPPNPLSAGEADRASIFNVRMLRCRVPTGVAAVHGWRCRQTVLDRLGQVNVYAQFTHKSV
jgi:hypothetical protein